MSAIQLLEDLRCSGATVEVAGDRLRIDAPVGLVTAKLVEQMRAHKTELIELLCASPCAGVRIEDLSPDWRVEWEERAAIREYDGGQVREHAEAEALREIVARMTAAGVGPK